MADANRCHTCPVWLGYFLLSPFRTFAQSPRRLLGPHVEEGMMAMDVGCAMGFFSLPLARLVGAAGRVICVDMQEKMLEVLRRRAAKAGLTERIELRRCSAQSLDLAECAGKVDFALAFAVVHEVSEPKNFIGEVAAALKPGAKFLLAEPWGHVRKTEFEATLGLAQASGLVVLERPAIWASRAALLRRLR